MKDSLLFHLKHRPKVLEDFVGDVSIPFVTSNLVIIHGNSGDGKTTLARILASQDSDFIEFDYTDNLLEIISYFKDDNIIIDDFNFLGVSAQKKILDATKSTNKMFYLCVTDLDSIDSDILSSSTSIGVSKPPIESLVPYLKEIALKRGYLYRIKT